MTAAPPLARFFGAVRRTGPDDRRAATPPRSTASPTRARSCGRGCPTRTTRRQGKDRPVLLLDTRGDGDGWVGLMLSSQDHDRDAEDEARHGRHWMDVGAGGWDSGGPTQRGAARPAASASSATTIRREGAALDETIFRDVVEAWRGLDR